MNSRPLISAVLNAALTSAGSLRVNEAENSEFPAATLPTAVICSSGPLQRLAFHQQDPDQVPSGRFPTSRLPPREVTHWRIPRRPCPSGSS